jgi:hypothetical protein
VSGDGQSTAATTAKHGVSVPVMITRQMEAELLRRGLTRAEIDKLTPQQAHEILATRATPASGSDQEDPEGETLI